MSTAYLGTTDALRRIGTIQNVPWYKNQLMARMLSLIRTINFSVQTERNAALNSIAGLPGDSPFAVGTDNNQVSTTNVRFPPGVIYICEAIQPWNNFFQTLISSLNYKDRVQEKAMLGNMQAPQNSQNSSTPSPMVAMSNFSDASQAFANTITNMLDALSTIEAVFDQAAFEQTFNVVWGVPTFQNEKGRFGTPIDTVIYFGDAVPDPDDAVRTVHFVRQPDVVYSRKPKQLTYEDKSKDS